MDKPDLKSLEAGITRSFKSNTRVHYLITGILTLLAAFNFYAAFSQDSVLSLILGGLMVWVAINGMVKYDHYKRVYQNFMKTVK